MIISITHEHDLDGLGSQAILKRFHDLKKKKLYFFFAHYLDFIKKIKPILDNNPTELFITDLGFNDDFLTVFNNFKHAKKKGTKIYWFDHHIVEEKIQDELRNFCEVYINDPRKCAAEIVQAYFLPYDAIAKEIASLAHDSDFKEYKFDISNNLQLIIEHNRGDSKIQEKNRIVDLLSKGDFENKWIESQIKELNEWYEKQSKLTLKNALKIAMEPNQEFVISHAELGGGKITDLLKEKYHDMLAYIGIDSRFNEIIIQSSKFNCRDFARTLGGGGHEERAGFSYKKPLIKKNRINPLFTEIIKNKLKEFK